MRFFQAKIILPVASILLLSIVGVVYLFFFPEPNHYHLITYKADIREGLPVYIENTRAGEIEWVRPVNEEQKTYIARFKLSDEVSIPVNSVVEVQNDDSGNSAGILIHVMASRTYFEIGDTIWLDGALELPKVETTGSGHKEDTLYYSVQLFVLTKELPANAEALKHLDEFYVKKEGETYKYFSGKLKTLAEAKMRRKELVAGGIKDAFIVPFLNEERISIEQALKYEN